MPAISAASVTAFFSFDVAEAIDLRVLERIIGSRTAYAKLQPKQATPSYVQYQEPPVVADGAVLDVAEVDGLRVRLKFYDYGVVSVALTRAFSGTWPELVALADELTDNEAIERQATDICHRTFGPFARAFREPHTKLLSEDYLVFTVTALERPVTAEVLLAEHGEAIAQLLRGERERLSDQEKTEILRQRISYLADDLVVPTWSSAFVYDNERGAQAILEIFEFANSQLLEFRYYDEWLDLALGRIYAELQHPRWHDWIAGRRYTRAAHQLHSLFIDVNELTDHTENALKMVGDIYAARVYTLTTARLGLGYWKESVREKLKTLDDIYRFAIEQRGIARGHLLELTIVLILVLELILFFMGIMT